MASNTKTKNGAGNGAGSEGMDRLKGAGSELFHNLGDFAVDQLNSRISGLTDKLSGIAEGGPVGKAVSKGGEAAAEGKNPVMGGLKGAVSGIKDKVTGGGGGKSSKGDATSSTNIIESIDVGVPISVAYNQWTQFGDFSSFMKKVEKAEAKEEEKLEWKAQIFLSHRRWEATILEQIPDERIVWRSSGEKGHVDGAVTFHEVAPNLTRILLVLEYYPQGLFEKTGNLWRAQGRRARAELRHFRRHVMTRTILNPDEVEGWRGVIKDGEVVESHEDHVAQEQEEQEQDDSGEDQDQPGSESDEYDDEYEDEAPEDEYDDEAEEDEPVDDEPEDEYDEAEEEEPVEEAEDEYDDVEEDEPADEDVEDLDAEAEEDDDDLDESDVEPEDETEEDREDRA